MLKTIVICVIGLLLGSGLGTFFVTYYPQLSSTSPLTSSLQVEKQKQVIGFLPYWLLPKANSDYSKYITTLTYFALRIDKDGSILKLTNPTEEEPGWYSLSSGKADDFLRNAKNKNITLSLAIDSGDSETINDFIAKPSQSASNLVSGVLPLMNKYGFSDLNFDIEYTQAASGSSRSSFTQFVKDVKNLLPSGVSLTLEISPIDVVQKHLIDTKSVAKYADNIVVMAYDYHSPNSIVTGPIAPLFGAGISSEYDVASAIEKTTQLINPQKVILGVPLYGYEWETLGNLPRAAAIPGSGVIASNKRAEDFLASCATCSAIFDSQSDETYISYLSRDTNTNHIISFPDKDATIAKLDFANKSGLGGIALWALGYEGQNILNPLIEFKNE